MSYAGHVVRRASLSEASGTLRRMTSVTAHDYAWIHNSPLFGLMTEFGHTLTLVRGRTPREVRGGRRPGRVLRRGRLRCAGGKRAPQMARGIHTRRPDPPAAGRRLPSDPGGRV
ncbi:DUF6461 domain-containing protein [Streptomyces althioticus]|uniref:DUF6461 domain-containing protein n=1 Tax=Streptomyces althioticus TaxID=83380 RepID=UPI0036B61EE0